MKKVMNKINFAIIGLMVAMPAFADSGLCGLVGRLQEVFRTLRTLAFVGAAFYIAGWAWEYIAAGKAEMKDVKGKGIGLLVGFALLFMISVLLSALLAAARPGGALECPEIITAGWE